MVLRIILSLMIFGVCNAQDVIPNMAMGSVSSGTGFFAVGSYYGNGVDNRAITDVGFQPDWVIIRDSMAVYSVFRTSAMGADTTAYLTSLGANFQNGIQSLDVDGFTLGTDTTVNGNIAKYYWIAGRSESGVTTVGKYYGNGVDNRSITGIGFQPDFVLVKRSGGDGAAVRVASFGTGDSCSSLGAASGTITDAIQAFETDGFQVGTNSRVNSAATWNYYIAIKLVTNYSWNAQYTGNQTARSFTLSAQPDYVAVFPHSSSYEYFKTTPMPVTGCITYHNQTMGLSSFAYISYINADGFSITNNAALNTTGIYYDYWVMRVR